MGWIINKPINFFEFKIPLTPPLILEFCFPKLYWTTKGGRALMFISWLFGVSSLPRESLCDFNCIFAIKQIAVN